MATYGFIAATEERYMYQRQYFGILAYGVEHNLGHVEFVEEAEFGLEDLENRNLCGLLEKLRTGDTLIVSDIHRLGRSTVEILGVFLKILRRQAVVCAFDVQHDLGSHPMFRGIPCIQSVLTLSLEEIELRLSKLSSNKKRIDGTAAVLGRPVGSIGVSRLDGREEEIKSMLADGVSKAETARQMSVSRPALHDFIVSRKLLENC